MKNSILNGSELLNNKDYVAEMVAKHVNKALEFTYSKTRVNTLVKEYTSTLEGVDSIVADFSEYMSELAVSSTEHAIYHYEILSSVKLEKLVNIGIQQLLSQSVATNNSYIDLNVLAYKIGQKAMPKKYRQGGTYVKTTTETKFTLGLNTVHFMAYIAGLCTIKSFKNVEGHTIKTVSSNIKLNDDLIAIKANKRSGTPMLCLPKKHTPENTGGYVLDSRTMLNSIDVVNQPQLVCDALNKMQAVAYRLRNNFPAMADYKLEDKWIDSNYKFMSGEWNKLLMDINVLIGKDFHFPMAADNRGRNYDRGNYVKLQGDKYQKAIREFADKQMLTKQGLKYLKVSIANDLYSDKVSFEKGLDWFNEHTIEELECMEQTPYTQVAIIDYKEHLAGNPVGTISHWDATNSGLQIYSLLGKDTITGLMCNVLGDEIADAYAIVAGLLNIRFETDIFTRSNVKHAFMTYLYGAGIFVIMCGKPLETKDNADIYYLFESIGIDKAVAWDAFETAMRETVPSAVALMELIYIFRNKETGHYSWTMPDGFQVEVQRSETVTIKGYAIDMKYATTHTGTLQTSVPKMDDSRGKGLAPDIIQSIDGYIVREVTRRCNFDLESIHDSFGCHPNNASKLREVVREVYADILDMNLLETILEEIDPNLFSVLKRKNRFTKGDLTREDVLNSVNIIR